MMLGSLRIGKEIGILVGGLVFREVLRNWVCWDEFDFARGLK